MYKGLKKVMTYPAGVLLMAIEALYNPAAKDEREVKRDRYGMYRELQRPPVAVDVTGLLVFAEDDAGGLMNPRYARLRPDIGVDEAISYLRKLARERLGTIYCAYDE